MITVLINVIVIWLSFFVVRAISKLVFKPLTAHWFSIGFYASFLIGILIVQSLYYSFDFLGSGFQFQRLMKFDAGLALLAALIPLNLFIVPSIYWWDKRLATRGINVRVPENALHALAFSGGFLGAFIGQKVFHHKVSKQSFKLKHYIVCGFSLLLYVYLGYVIYSVW